MLIKGIGVNPADMMPAVEQGIPENAEQVQPEENMFGPEYEVTISEEGRNLSRQQAAQPGADVQGAQSDKMAEVMLRQLEEAQFDARTRKGYYDELEELEKQIKVMNAAYGRMRSDKSYNDPLMKELVEQQRQLQEQMQENKDFQEEEALRRLKEAQQIAAMKSAQGKEEVDENNRDLVALLKTMEEAKKAAEELENGASEEDGDTSGKENSAADAIHNSAAGVMTSSLNHEKGVEELSNKVGDFGHWFLSQADSIAQDLLRQNRFLKEALKDKSFTTGQLGEMMQSYRREVSVKSEEAYIFGSFGTQVLRDMRDVKLQRISDNPLQSMQLTKDGMMQAAVDAALGEARQSSLDETSRELADEVERLIDERNHVDRIPQNKKDGEEYRTQEKLLQPEVQES